MLPILYFPYLYNELKKTNEIEIIKKFTSNKHDQVFLFDILFQDQFQKIRDLKF